MKSEKRVVEIRLLSPMLGTVPKNKEVYAKYIATKAAEIEQVEEVETVQEVEEKGWTGFHQDEDGIFIYDYMVKGFLKSAAEVLQATGEVKKIPSYKKWFDALLFVYPRRLRFDVKEPDGTLERPLRAMTMQGPRVSLSRSDMVSEGRKFKCEIEILDNSKGITWELVEKCLDYGKYVALGQWRGSGGYGRIEWSNGG